jgi:POT family proton-dependent oligopeptide transporter
MGASNGGPVPATTDDTAFFGQPRGLAYLAFTQVWERFSFYGMQALLLLYMVNHLLLPGRIENVLGFAAFRTGIEAVFGPLTTLALASQIFGLYTGLTGLTPLLGAWLGDRVIGQRATAIIGLVLMTIGHGIMAVEALFLPALLLLVLGAGCLKGNMYTQVGNLYADGDGRSTTAFSIFLIALNIGAFAAPLVCGTLGEVYGWHYGFAAAGIGMLIGLGIYLSGWRYLPPDRFKAARGDVPPLKPVEWRAVAAILLTMLPALIVATAAFQAYNLVIVWAEQAVDRSVGGFTMPVTWLFTVDGLMTIFGILITLPVWRWLRERQREPDTLQKFLGAGVFVTLAYTMLALAAARPGLVPLALVILFFAVSDLCWGWLDPPGNAFVARFAPPAVMTTMISIYMMALYGVPQLTVGWLGRFYEPLGPVNFWWLHAGIAAAGAGLALLLRPLAALLLDHREAAAAIDAGAVPGLPNGP